MNEADNILRILTEAKDAIEKKDSYKLKTLSDQTIHSAAIYQDADNIVVAVVIYSLAKIIERDKYRQMEGWDKFYSTTIKNLDLSIEYISTGEFEKFLLSMGKIRNSINEIKGSLSAYIRDVFYKAGINKAFKLYEHGLSSEKTAELLGISLWDLAGYIGQSTVSESHLNEALPVRDRVKLVENFFK